MLIASRVAAIVILVGGSLLARWINHRFCLIQEPWEEKRRFWSRLDAYSHGGSTPKGKV